MQPNDLIDNLPKLRWACRRGMLELDVLLGNFLNEAYVDLSNEQKLSFVGLLQTTDPELFSWLLGASTPTAQFEIIVSMIRRHAKQRI